MASSANTLSKWISLIGNFLTIERKINGQNPSPLCITASHKNTLPPLKPYPIKHPPSPPRLAECHVTKNNSGAKCQRVHILRCRGEGLASLDQCSTLRLCFTWCLREGKGRRRDAHLNIRDAHLNIRDAHLNIRDAHLNIRDAHLNIRDAHLNNKGCSPQHKGCPPQHKGCSPQHKDAHLNIRDAHLNIRDAH